jgi:hypothetical protein
LNRKSSEDRREYSPLSQHPTRPDPILNRSLLSEFYKRFN